ncbi:DNA polymerase III subunit psi [Shewanella sp. SR44-3]|uniref:DNA polymerase III subunit psi n=1 Tax=unclassified Shewanella TaxID=196818 RepID=UPI0015FD7DEC|nr:DNA polymerase III subunit psi [Shewanella sp. SR44-3]MBB1270016.1 DNA polymerase III subunit psi [Shewanella sp. SR44-3]
MDKKVFLDAMGISRWHFGAEEVKPFMVLCDGEFESYPEKQPLIAEVLCLLGLKLSQCQFGAMPIKGVQVVWDLRHTKTRPRTAWINSEPLLALLSSDGSLKRVLWQQICQHLNQSS